MHEGNNISIEQGESYGLRSIVGHNIVKSYQFTWFDTGVPEGLKATREVYRQLNEPNILEKENEAIWFIDENVIKYSDDENFITNRVKRVNQLQGFVPEVYDSKKNIVAKLKPENRFYPIENNFTTEASIHTNLFRDLYIVLGEGNSNDGWVVRIYYNPLVIWIWIGALVIFLGGITSININLKKLKILS